ncbi:MAG TPA: Zn-ribbon domain-containing OB-fold protein [Acidimicrobiia bacterium]
MSEAVQFMSQMVSVEYPSPQPTLVNRRFAEQLEAGRIIGHKCPQCGLVYVPPRGMCPVCVVSTTDDHEVEVADRGTVTTFSVITPIQYPGQEEQDDYVLATILLDGADMTVGQQRLDGIPIDDVHSGMRVEAAWAPESERKAAGGPGPAGGLGGAIQGWRPTGEPDTPLDQYEHHIL